LHLLAGRPGGVLQRVGSSGCEGTTPPPKVDRAQEAAFIKKAIELAPKYRTELLKEAKWADSGEARGLIVDRYSPTSARGANYVPGESGCSGSVLLDRYEENRTVERNLAYLLPENLYRVFNETDLNKRKAAIADLWDEDGISSIP
jgi:hypothetical protein